MSATIIPFPQPSTTPTTLAEGIHDLQVFEHPDHPGCFGIVVVAEGAALLRLLEAVME